MKNKSFISVVFGLVMLAAISYQIMDNFGQWSIDKENIELSESSNDIEEEEELNESNLLADSFYRTDFIYTPTRFLNWKEDSSQFLSVYIKIPLPPPELA